MKLITIITILLKIGWLGGYLLSCLILYPVLIIILVLIAKFTNICEKLNRWLDRKAEKKKKKNERKKKKTAASESVPEKKEAENKEQKEPTEEDDEIARFRLYVGNGYKCRLPNDDPSNISNNVWSSENKFIGDFSEGRNSNLFWAEKAGKTCLLFGEKTYYEIYVLANNPKWFAEEYYNIILNEKNTDFLKMKMATGENKIILNDFNNGLYSYAGKNETVQISFAEDTHSGKVKRILLEFKSDNEKFDEFLKDLNERMSLLEKYDENGKKINQIFKDTDIRLWYHETLKSVNGKYQTKVDAVAFVKMLKNGNYVFGIGRTWRLLAERVEVQDNRNMILKSFYAILPEELKEEVENNDRSFIREEKKNAPEKDNGTATENRNTAEKTEVKKHDDTVNDTHEDTPEDIQHGSEEIPETPSEEGMDEPEPDTGGTEENDSIPSDDEDQDPNMGEGEDEPYNDGLDDGDYNMQVDQTETEEDEMIEVDGPEEDPI